MTRLRHAAPWLVASLVGHAACAPESIIIAKEDDDAASISTTSSDAGTDAGDVLPSSAEASGDAGRARFDAGMFADSCTDNTGCSPTTYCRKQRCSDARGTCESRTTACGNEYLPVCGCDGISYFNDCLRIRSGIAAVVSTTTECVQEVKRCSSLPGDGCPQDSVCSFIQPRVCAQDGLVIQGKCWTAPVSCSVTLGVELFTSCAPTNGMGDHDCVDACTAIKSGRSYVPAFGGCTQGPRDRPDPNFGL